jgi:hypothetical protein
MHVCVLAFVRLLYRIRTFSSVLLSLIMQTVTHLIAVAKMTFSALALLCRKRAQLQR